MTRRFGAGFLGVALCAMALVGACGEKKGALILAINTDMKAPKDVNAVSVTVSTNGAIKHSFIGRVTPQGEVLLPATLAIVEPDDSAASIRIRVIAFQERKPRVLRDVRTTVPREGRTALLRIPLNFVNDGSTKSADLPANVLPAPNPGTGPTMPVGGSSGSSGTSGGGDNFPGGAADFDFFGAFQPECPDVDNQTFIDGECKDNFVDPAVLPDYEDTLVYGSGGPEDTSNCFQVASCFQGASAIQEGGGSDISPAPADGGTGSGDGGVREMTFTPQAISLNRSSCTIALNGADPSQLNLAIVTNDTGECVKEGECYIPIDQGASGWRVENGSVQLPRVVCTLLGKGLRLFQTTNVCKAKTESQPICRPKPAVFQCANPTFSACGKCLETSCLPQATKCFGPDWVKGTYSGVCKTFLECFCACTDGECKQCDQTQAADGCDQCLKENVEPCLKQNACPCGSNRTDPIEGGTGANSYVSLTFSNLEPPPVPSVGSGFMNQSTGAIPFDDPGSGQGARAVAATRQTDQAYLKISYCSTPSPGATFTKFRAFGTNCTSPSSEPQISFSLPPGGAQPQAIWNAFQGTLKVVSTTPLLFQFENVVMTATSGEGGATGAFLMSGAGQWSP
jgi:hypothetical protein